MCSANFSLPPDSQDLDPTSPDLQQLKSPEPPGPNKSARVSGRARGRGDSDLGEDTSQTPGAEPGSAGFNGLLPPRSQMLQAEDAERLEVPRMNGTHSGALTRSEKGDSAEAPLPPLPLADLKVWAAQLRLVATDERRTASCCFTAEALAEEFSAVRKKVPLSEFTALVKAAVQTSEKRFANRPEPRKARALRDTAELNAISLLKALAESPEQECFILGLEQGLRDPQPAHQNTTPSAFAAQTSFVRSAEFRRVTEMLQREWRSVAPIFLDKMDPVAGTELTRAVEHVLTHVMDGSEALQLEYLHALQQCVRGVKRKGVPMPTERVPDAERKKFDQVLAVFEKQFLFESLVDVRMAFEALERAFPKSGFGYCAHVAASVRGAVLNSTWLSSYHKFGEELRKFRSDSVLDRAPAARVLLEQLYETLEIFGPLISKKREM